MRRSFISVVLTVMLFMPSFAQNVNTDSIKAEMDKIEITNQAMKQVIEKYKKGVIKGDPESMNLLGMECLSGKYVKANLEMGLNLLDAAAKLNYVDAQYNLGNYFYLFWLSKPENDGLFSSGVKWLKKAVKGGSVQAIITMASFYNEYGKHKNEPSYIDGGIKLLESYPKISEVSNKSTEVLNAQALAGTICLGKWRFDNDTIALRDAKKWYQILLKSSLEFPDYSPYIDSLKTVLSMGVPMRIDPMPTPEDIEKSKQPAGGMGGFPGMGGGFGGGGFGGGFPGMGGAPGGAQGPQGPQGPQATFPGGNMEMQQFIRSNTNYPENLKNQKISGRATVSFTVDTDGSIINPTITTHAMRDNVEIYILDQEALRTVMVMPDWIPAEENGQPVQAQHSVSVSFGSGGMGGMGGFGF